MLKYLLSIFFLSLTACPVVAQELQEQADAAVEEVSVAFRPHPDQITVVATGIEGRDARSAYPVSVLSDYEIRRLQGQDVARALRALPGVTMTRNGGPGAFTGVSVRGSGSEQLLVLVDGVRINDLASPGGGFDFGSMTAGELGKVEMLRGAHSIVWGSDAIAGVMNIASRSPDGMQVAMEYGGADQFSADAVWGRDGQAADISLSGGFTDAAGFSAAERGTEKDGFRQWNLGARGNADVDRRLRLTGSARIADASAEIDGFPAPDYILTDTRERQDTQRFSSHLGAEWRLDHTRLQIALNHSTTDRDLLDEAVSEIPNYVTRGGLWQVDLRGRHQFQGALDGFAMTLGADWQRSDFLAQSAYSSDEGRAETASFHALATLDKGGWELSGGARYDHHSRFGGEWTIGAAGALHPARGLDFRASYGEGFKAPTLFQLLSEYGNLALSPERSRSYDAGVHYAPVRRVQLDLSLFRRDSSGLIDYVSCFADTGGICADRPFGTYDNIGRARAQGFELEADVLVGEDYAGDLHVRAAWSFVDATNRTPGSAMEGKRLARRPRHAITLSADKTLSRSLFAASLGLDLRYASASFDDAANTVRLGSRLVMDLRASRPLLEVAGGQRTLDLTARIENLWDEQYQTAAGYATQGRAAFVGLRVRL